MKTIKFFLVTGLMITLFDPQTIGQAKQAESAVQSEPEKEKIKSEDLPAATTKLLKGDAFKGWTIVQAYKVKSKDAQGKEIAGYEVEVKKDNVTQVLKFDKDGKAR